jgi:Zn-dependent protease
MAMLGQSGFPVVLCLMLNLILFLPVLLIALQVVAFYLQAQRLLQVRFRYPRYEVQRLRELSTDLKQSFAPTIERLQALGFEPCGAYRVQKIFHFDHADDRAVLLYHPAVQTFAEVEIRFPADGKDLTNVNFYQAFNDQTWLLTMNGQAHGVIGTLPDTIVADPYCASLEAQWQYHQTQRATIDSADRSLKPGKFIAALQDQQQRYVDILLAKKILTIRREGWFLSGKAAFQTAWKMRQGITPVSKRHSARQKLLLKQPELVQEVPLSLQIQTFQRLRSLETNHRDLRLGKWLLLGSLGLFILVAIALPNTFGTFKTRDLVTLLGVLFLHEAGHFLAMKAFGYRDTKMFFLPLFGAAVTGRKADASLSEKVWVLLAGPLPGLLLGLGLMVGIHGHPAAQGWESTAWMLITLNLLNLLPIYPLDGGKIAHHLLFSRYPWTDVVFKVFTVLLFGFCSFLSPSLLVLAIATGLSIPNSYRTAKLNLTIQQGLAGDHASADVLLTMVFQQMGAAGYGQLPLAKRDAIAKDLIDRQRESRAPLLSRLGLAGIYAFSLVGGCSATVMAVMPQAREAIRSNQMAAASDARSLQQANRIIQQQPRSASGYIQRATIYQQRFAIRAAALATPVSQRLTTATRIHPDHPGYGDLTKALADYDTAIQLEPDHPEFYQTRVQLKRLMGKRESAIADYQALIQRDSQNPLLYFDRAELHQSLGRHRAAIADANQSIQLKAHNPDAYELRSQSKQALADRAGALRDQQQADQLRRQLATTAGA